MGKHNGKSQCWVKPSVNSAFKKGVHLCVMSVFHNTLSSRMLSWLRAFLCALSCMCNCFFARGLACAWARQAGSDYLTRLFLHVSRGATCEGGSFTDNGEMATRGGGSHSGNTSLASGTAGGEHLHQLALIFATPAVRSGTVSSQPITAIIPGPTLLLSPPLKQTSMTPSRQITIPSFDLGDSDNSQEGGI